MEDCCLPDLRDIELKLGRKVPESLVRSLRGEEPVAGKSEKDREPPGGKPGPAPAAGFSPAVLRGNSSSALERLETKLHLLRQEMRHRSNARPVISFREIKRNVPLSTCKMHPSLKRLSASSTPGIRRRQDFQVIVVAARQP
uniref:Uncharacterized protein n=1 Tax=Sphaerodactylus townsendi TaxID=933632 RepID=A0ACB8ESN9_9SAUR